MLSQLDFKCVRHACFPANCWRTTATAWEIARPGRSCYKSVSRKGFRVAGETRVLQRTLHVPKKQNCHAEIAQCQNGYICALDGSTWNWPKHTIGVITLFWIVCLLSTHLWPLEDASQINLFRHGYPIVRKMFFELHMEYLVKENVRSYKSQFVVR